MGNATKEKPAKPKKPRKGKHTKKKGWLTAATADPHVLYEKSVQDPESEVELIDQVWNEQRNRQPRLIREDFCGTAVASAAWVKHREDNQAIAVDIDADVLKWGTEKNKKRLDESQRERLTVLKEDVLTVQTEKVDSVLAMNFSYFLFKTRESLGGYFRKVHASLVDDGLFLLDCYGGSDSFAELEEERDCDGFTYVWDQRVYNPITGEAINHIHFRFPDGTEMKDAFTYHWRLWTLPELRELLSEAGFRDVVVYWEGSDEETGEGNGEFTPTVRGEACDGWIAYLVAMK